MATAWERWGLDSIHLKTGVQQAAVNLSAGEVTHKLALALAETIPQDAKLHPLYASPPARKPLSDEQIRDAAKYAGLDWQRGFVVDDVSNRYADFARAVERAHGIGDE